jgi:hypothetical protein
MFTGKIEKMGTNDETVPEHSHERWR